MAARCSTTKVGSIVGKVDVAIPFGDGFAGDVTKLSIMVAVDLDG
jgi:hypothetical protein